MVVNSFNLQCIVHKYFDDWFFVALGTVTGYLQDISAYLRQYSSNRRYQKRILTFVGQFHIHHHFTRFHPVFATCRKPTVSLFLHESTTTLSNVLRLVSVVRLCCIRRDTFYIVKKKKSKNFFENDILRIFQILIITIYASWTRFRYSCGCSAGMYMSVVCYMCNLYHH